MQHIIFHPGISLADKVGLLATVTDVQYGFDTMSRHKAPKFDPASVQVAYDPYVRKFPKRWEDLLDRVPWTQAEKDDYVRRTHDLERVAEQLAREAQSNRRNPDDGEQPAQRDDSAVTRRP